MTRQDFIGNVCKILGRDAIPKTVAPVQYRHQVHQEIMADKSPEQLAAAFIEYSKTIGVDVYETDAASISSTILEAVQAIQAETVLLADDARLKKWQVAETLRQYCEVNVWNTEESRERNIQNADRAKVGIAVAELALAESATVLLFSQGGNGRSVTLLPEATIYIVPQSLIKPRLTQGMELLAKMQENELPSSLNFVSGPSATSDIELVRVVGVHGPMRVVHVVVKDV